MLTQTVELGPLHGMTLNLSLNHSLPLLFGSNMVTGLEDSVRPPQRVMAPLPESTGMIDHSLIKILFLEKGRLLKQSQEPRRK